MRRVCDVLVYSLARTQRKQEWGWLAYLRASRSLPKTGQCGMHACVRLARAGSPSKRYDRASHPTRNRRLSLPALSSLSFFFVVEHEPVA